MKSFCGLALLLIICSSDAGANILITSRASSSWAEASHQDQGAPRDGYEYDADSGVQLFNGYIFSGAKPGEYNYGGSAATYLFYSADDFVLGAFAGADRVLSGSDSFVKTYGEIEVTFSVDALTHVDIAVDEIRVGGASATGQLQLFKGAALLAVFDVQTEWHGQAAQRHDLALDLLAGDYRIVATSSAASFIGDCAEFSCSSHLDFTLSTTANVAAVPVPAAGWLLGPAVLALFGIGARRKS